jgi:hypothetical protein
VNKKYQKTINTYHTGLFILLSVLEHIVIYQIISRYQSIVNFPFDKYRSVCSELWNESIARSLWSTPENNKRGRHLCQKCQATFILHDIALLGASVSQSRAAPSNTLQWFVTSDRDCFLYFSLLIFPFFLFLLLLFSFSLVFSLSPSLATYFILYFFFHVLLNLFPITSLCKELTRS